jgi:hypothetical protein
VTALAAGVVATTYPSGSDGLYTGATATENAAVAVLPAAASAALTASSHDVTETPKQSGIVMFGPPVEFQSPSGSDPGHAQFVGSIWHRIWFVFEFE